MLSGQVPDEAKAPAKHAVLTVSELILRYYLFAESYYQKDGKPTSELTSIRLALGPLRKLYGHTPAEDFGPRDYKLVREELLRKSLSRKYINDCMGRIRRMFRWAVEDERVSVTVYQSLLAVPGLKRGRSEARESRVVLPVTEADFEATLPHLPPVVADMARLQRLTGMRPQEICLLRPRDLDRSDEIWEYRPQRHKTQHHGRSRVIFIGPRGQEILMPYLLRADEDHCFSPAESEKARRQEAHEQRKDAPLLWQTVLVPTAARIPSGPQASATIRSATGGRSSVPATRPASRPGPPTSCVMRQRP